MAKFFHGCDDVGCACLYGSQDTAKAGLLSYGFRVNETIPCWYNGSGSTVVLVNQGFTYSISVIGLVLLSLGATLLIWSVLHLLGLDCKVLEAILRFLCCGHYDEWERRHRRQLWQRTRAYGTNNSGLVGYMLRARTAGLLPEEIQEVLQKSEISHQALEDLKKRAESSVEERSSSSADLALEAETPPPAAVLTDRHETTAAETTDPAADTSVSRTLSEQPIVVGDLADCGICLDELLAPLASEDSVWEDDQVRNSQMRYGLGQAARQTLRGSMGTSTRLLEEHSASAETTSARPAPAARDVSGQQGTATTEEPTEPVQNESRILGVLGRLFQAGAERAPRPTTTLEIECRESDIEAARDSAQRCLASESQPERALQEGAVDSAQRSAGQPTDANFSAAPRRIVLLKCGHVFHFSCMKHFLCAGGVTCPICNRNIARDYLAASDTPAGLPTGPGNGSAASGLPENATAASRSMARTGHQHASRVNRLLHLLTQPRQWRWSSTPTRTANNRNAEPTTELTPPPRAMVQLRVGTGDVQRHEPDYGLIMVPRVDPRSGEDRSLVPDHTPPA
jgi:hypothetical protein